MQYNSKQAKRLALKQLGAFSSVIAAPSLLMANDVAEQTSNESSVAVSDTTEPEAEKIEMERYGIRQFDAPEIRLDYWIDANGEPTSFSVNEQRGKWLFMKFFQNWCPGCHSLGFPTMQKFVAEFDGNPKVAAIAVQTVFEGFDHNTKSAVRELQMRYELPIVMGHDQGTALTDNLPLSMLNYRSGGTPWLILVSPEGQVVMNDFHMDADALISFVKSAIS